MKLRLVINVSQCVQRIRGERDRIKKHFSTDSSSIQLQNMNYIQICGKDTKKFLQSLCTNDIAKLKQRGDAIAAVFLNTKGRIVADTLIIDNSSNDNNGEESVILEVHNTVKEPLLKHLNIYKLRSKVTLSSKPLLSKVFRYANTAPPSSSVNDLIFADPRSSFFGYKGLFEPSSQDNIKGLKLKQFH